MSLLSSSLKVRKILSVPEASLPDLKFLGRYQ
jgi:hypothetical protein